MWTGVVVVVGRDFQIADGLARVAVGRARRTAKPISPSQWRTFMKLLQLSITRVCRALAVLTLERCQKFHAFRM
jgi:hypothetical protein